MQLSVTGAELIVKVRHAEADRSRQKVGLNAVQGILLACAIGLMLWPPIIAGLWMLFA